MVHVGELPPCCRACELYEAGAQHCLLLVHPTGENRRHLLTVPCGVEALLERRFRSHGPKCGPETVPQRPRAAIDGVGYSMVVELMRGELAAAAAWRVSLPCSDATATDRKYLAIYRYCALFFDILREIATNQLSAAKARAVSEHLMVCDDGRCVAFVRASSEDVDAAAAVLYPAELAEGIGMHARTFLCREALWQAFEEMAREQGAPIDDVLSDAMRSYARARQYGAETAQPQYGAAPDSQAHDYDAENAPDLARTSATRSPQPQRLQGPTAESRAAGRLAAPPSRASTMGMPGSPPGGPPPMMGNRGAPAPMQRPFTQPLNQLPPPPARGRPMASSPPPPARGGMPASRSVPPPPRSMPPPLPPSDPLMPAAQNQSYGGRGRAAPTPERLTLAYNGRHVDVTKERFILGRSKTQADLVLEDPNVSRQHAAIERVGDAWFLADLGSTNGCYIDGQRVSRRQIADGDVIEITTHQVQCSLR